jgi:membrane protein YqaA with SNARE-associated domain
MKEKPRSSKETQEEEYQRFVWTNVLRGIAWLVGIIMLYLLAQWLLPADWSDSLARFTDNPPWVFFIFFLSEAFTGLIPLEFFIIWAKSESLGTYSAYVLLLSVLSYLGGMIAFGIGSQVRNFRWLKRFSELETFQRYATLYRRYGGIIIIISSLTPLPFAIICFLSATFRFPFRRYLLYTSMRFLRFAVLGWLLWKIGA